MTQPKRKMEAENRSGLVERAILRPRPQQPDIGKIASEIRDLFRKAGLTPNAKAAAEAAAEAAARLQARFDREFMRVYLLKADSHFTVAQKKQALTQKSEWYQDKINLVKSRGGHDENDQDWSPSLEDWISLAHRQSRQIHACNEKPSDRRGEYADWLRTSYMDEVLNSATLTPNGEKMTQGYAAKVVTGKIRKIVDDGLEDIKCISKASLISAYSTRHADRKKLNPEDYARKYPLPSFIRDFFRRDEETYAETFSAVALSMTRSGGN